MSDNLDDIFGTKKETVASPSAGTASGAPATGRVAKLIARYRDGYRVSGFVVGMGTLCKAVGFILGGIIVLVAIAQMNNLGPAAIGAALIGVLIIAVFFVAGVMVSAVGQMHKATLDSAVNNSPFLNNDDRARIMSLD